MSLLSPSTTTPLTHTFMPPMTQDKDLQFAFARVKGEVRLVQLSCATPSSAFVPVDVNLFKHEFITIFRLQESTTLHPADFSIIECLDDSQLRYEEDNDTVFLAKDLIERMRQLTVDPRKMAFENRRYRYPLQQRYRQR